MKVEISVRDSSGARLPQVAQNAPAYATDVFHSVDEQAEARVQEIIAANDSVEDVAKHVTGKVASLR
jgi:hypothetical protein